MGTRRPPDQAPPDDAYSRVTEPERFQVVVDAADRLVAELLATFDVEVVPVEHPDAVRAVRLVPAEGSPLEVRVSSFPGVTIAFGALPYGVVSLPTCGCDACDEDPDLLVEQLVEAVGAVVTGRLVERLGRVTAEVQVGDTGTGGPVTRSQRRALLEAGVPPERTWPAWPVRAARPAPAT